MCALDRSRHTLRMKRKLRLTRKIWRIVIGGLDKEGGKRNEITLFYSSNRRARCFHMRQAMSIHSSDVCWRQLRTSRRAHQQMRR